MGKWVERPIKIVSLGGDEGVGQLFVLQAMNDGLEI